MNFRPELFPKQEGGAIATEMVALEGFRHELDV